jgi:hypothetical protein
MKPSRKLVYALDFGSIWWLRPGASESGEHIWSRSAIFNTTGFQPGKQYCWVIRGVIRFNRTDIHFRPVPPEFQGRLYSSVGVEQYEGSNRLLLRPASSGSPDSFLVRVSSQMNGEIKFSDHWRTDGVRIVASSEFKRKQETLLLVDEGAFFETDFGIWGVKWNAQHRAQLSLTDLTALP